MKKFKLLTVLTLFFTFCVAEIKAKAPTADDDRPTYTGYILRIDESIADIEIEELERSGVKVLYRRGDMILTFVPDDLPDQKDAPSALKGKGKNFPGRKFYRNPYNRKRNALKNIETLDKSHSMAQVDKIHTGTPESQPFDGSGVVVGFCDIGFDSRHINFLNAAGNECRIRKVVDYDDEHGERMEYNTPREIYDWETDNDDKFHATHVAGIMTGAYDKSGYRGVAPGADIVATTSQLSDVAILAGVEDIIAYAKSVDKPAVINLSVGNYLGAHDGTSLFSQYLDRCAEDAIICVSAGNEGTTRNHIEKKFTDTDNKLFCIFANNKWDNIYMYGATDFYSDSAAPFTISINLRNDNYTCDRMQYSSPTLDFNGYSEWVLTSNPELKNEEGYYYCPEFAKYFQGEVYLSGGVDPENGRFHVQVYYDCTTDIMMTPNAWAKYRLGVELTGTPGMTIEGFADSTHSWFGNITSYFFRGNSDFCISDLATGHNVISVGMYCTRENVLQENGNSYPGGEPYSISEYSGYGTLRDGRVLPMTVAPGSPIVSSYSTPYIRKYGSGETSFKTLPEFAANTAPDDMNSADNGPILYNEETTEDPISDEENYYYWAPHTGTSMSTPYVAGVIATWLQADRNLTSSKVIEIIEKTNERDLHTLESNPRHGRGYLQAYDGLLEVLRGVNTVVNAAESPQIKAWVRGNELNVYNPSGKEMTVSFHSTDGRLLKKISIANESFSIISIEDLPAGIIIGKIDGKSSIKPTTLKIIK